MTEGSRRKRARQQNITVVQSGVFSLNYGASKASELSGLSLAAFGAGDAAGVSSVTRRPSTIELAAPMWLVLCACRFQPLRRT